ncbi:MAG: hypothetical protein CMJ58_28185 [Planctomycetaceae bacterium]|nr:hypothetical protein [Planctomycetaceae bacterium]
MFVRFVPRLAVGLACALAAVGDRAVANPDAAGPVPASPTLAPSGADTAEPSDAGADFELVQPPSVVEPPVVGDSAAGVQPLPPTGELTLEFVQQLALSNNPSIHQAAAQVAALRGKWLQAGLAPNPTAGYVASEIGGDGSAGQQGGYVGQQFITAHKLQRDRNIVAAEIAKAQQQLAAMQVRVRTDVRQAYYRALLAQRRVEVAGDLTAVAESAATASQQLYDAEEIPLAGLLQTEITQQNAMVALRTARNSHAQAWRELSAVVASDALPPQPLAGDISQLPATLDWQQQQMRILQSSPEVAAAMADVSRARRALNRACVEPIPDVSTQVSVQYDASSQDTIAGVQIGVPLPLWNRNQGGIRQAQAEISAAVRNVDRVEQQLSQRLAGAFRRYADALVTAQTYATEILPRSERTLALVRRGYDQGETGYLPLLAAQQTYFQANLAYLDALGEVWDNHIFIDGLLLDGSLAARAE